MGRQKEKKEIKQGDTIKVQPRKYDHPGQPRKYNPEELWTAAKDYFKWCDDNPLIEIDYKGINGRVELPKIRAYTITGLCIHINISRDTFNSYSKTAGYSDICTRIQEIIYTQKFEGAAAGFLVPQIIARDLGLKDTTETNISGTITIDPKQWTSSDTSK